MSERVDVALACGDCESRNYKTTRKKEQKGQIELKKFCPKCRKHTLHKETK
jgi:large subunit ribosomal protein L33